MFYLYSNRGGVTVKVHPLADRVLIKPLEEEEIKKGGIIIPDTAKEKPHKGEIMAVGKGRLNDEGKRVAIEVKKGDKVLFNKYAGTEINIDDLKYIILQENDILATLE
jgi:chaperonin GroES